MLPKTAQHQQLSLNRGESCLTCVTLQKSCMFKTSC